MKKILVLDANQRSALATTRSLGRHCVEVFTAEETPNALASSSRFSKQHFTYPSPRMYPDDFIAALTQLTKDQHIDVLMPMTELTVMLLVMHKSSFRDVSIPFSDMATIESFTNKCALMKTAELLGIAVPRTWYADDADNLPCDIETLSYPVVVKPGKSWLFHNRQWSRVAVRFAESPGEVKSILNADWAFRAHPFMIQENIVGHGAGVFAIYDHGRLLALFAHRRLREKPPRGGVSVLSESILVDPELALYTRRLLEHACWHGVAMVEFKIAHDGTPYLMEINTRFWGSLQLAIDAGIDFPYMLYQLACDERADQVGDYKIGIRLRWLLGDLDNLYLTLRNSRIATGIKISAVMRFFAPSPARTRHEVNRISDLKPFWYEFRQYLRDIAVFKSNR
ncbi:MAG: ATP-grasp domain-containing protein [Gammaproteobacteria bacterium]|nr:ATP-grasp domain-containing protein [Gammaproteobacteria bacterium]